MEDELETLVLKVRADTGGFARDVAEMRGQLDGPLARGAEAAGGAIENALSRAARTGKFGFDDLKRTAVAALAEIAAGALRVNVGGAGGGVLGSLVTGAASLLGAPGRATGGPVAGGRAYMVGERGPELFVPTSAGVVRPAAGAAARGPISVTVNVNAAGGEGGEYMARTGAQVARAVRGALLRAGG